MTVRYADIDDLTKDIEFFRESIERDVVRICRDDQEVNNGVKRVCLKVTFRIDGEVHGLDMDCGMDILGGEKTGSENADEILELMKNNCETLGLQVLGGFYED